MELPRIDLQNDRNTVIEQLMEAISKYGAFYVKTGFTKAQDDLLFNTASDVFDCSAEIKKEHQVQPGGFTRGFIKLGGESGSQEYELKEGFSYGYELDREPENKLQGPNVWPLKNKEPLIEFYNFCSELSRQLTSLLSEGMTGDLRWLDLCNGGETISLMRLFHYFSETGSLGSSPHTDWGFLTLIKARESQPALQVASSNGNGIVWNNVPCTLDSEPWAWFVVNAGDFMSMISNGKSISPLHRVISTETKRTSFVYFSYPSYHSRVPEFKSDKLSLFQDQKNSVMGKRNVEDTTDCFGDFIFKKWEQVSRY